MTDNLAPTAPPTATKVTDTPVPTPILSIPSIPSATSPSSMPTRQTVTATWQPVVSSTGGTVTVYEGSLTLTVYPYAQSLVQLVDAAHHFTYYALDRNAYEKALSAQETSSRLFRTVILENEFLKLTFLPDLGGRLYQVMYKPTGQTLFYNNRVLKPSPWGPVNDSGWLAAGGMEWAFPVNEHGYEWGIPWQYTVMQNMNGATITLADSTAPERVRARISVTLPAHAAYFVVHPRIENPTGSPASLQFWINAQITLGANKNVSSNTDFVLPSSSVFVHSTGDTFIPERNVPPDDQTGPRDAVSWPVIGGVDLSRYGNWQDYLGVFAANLTGSFVGAYNHDNNLGLVRVFPSSIAPGVKLFAFGPRFCCRNQFADDGSDYFELWGGLPRTFFPSDDVTLGPREAREWDEYWMPFAGTGGLSGATRNALLYLARDGNLARVAVYAPMARTGTAVLSLDGTEVGRWYVSLVPGMPFTAASAIGQGKMKLRLLANDGTILVESNQDLQ